MSRTLQFVTPSSKTATFLSADHSANQAINQSNKQSHMDDCNPLRQQSVDDRDLDCFNSDSKRRTLPFPKCCAFICYVGDQVLIHLDNSLWLHLDSLFQRPVNRRVRLSRRTTSRTNQVAVDVL